MQRSDPARTTFPRFLTQVGPMVANLREGYWTKVQIVSADEAPRQPDLRPGDLYVFGLVSPADQEDALYPFG
jgi:hypothetical protein